MQIYKFNNQKVFFASDFHLSHLRDFVWNARGFGSVKEHADTIIEALNQKVGENDVLFYLGDFALNSNPEEAKSYFRRIKCKNIHYIWGNHESSTSSIYKEALKNTFGALLPIIPSQVYPFKWENVKFLGNSANISVNGQVIVLSHFAYFIWDMMQHGAWNICGHSHSNAPALNAEALEGKVFDVGVDNALKLTTSSCFSFEEIEAIMKKKPIVLRDHHNSQTT